MKILLVEDDADTAQYLARGLSGLGHAVRIAADGADGLNYARLEAWDLLIVDRVLPTVDGLRLIRSLRASDSETRVMLLTSVGGIDERVHGLDAGADDCLEKPFAFAELAARAAALYRRPRDARSDVILKIDDIEMDLVTRTVRRGGLRIDLSPREFRLFEYLIRNVDQTVTRSMLLEHVWNLRFDPYTTVVEAQISRLRGKLEKGHSGVLIQTIRGAGYRLCLRE